MNRLQFTDTSYGACAVTRDWFYILFRTPAGNWRATRYKPGSPPEQAAVQALRHQSPVLIRDDAERACAAYANCQTVTFEDDLGNGPVWPHPLCLGKPYRMGDLR